MSSFLKMTVVVGLLVVVISCQSEQEVKHAQYIAEGFAIYKAHCANCHQQDGRGLKNLYPPITKEYLTNEAQLICWIKYGINEPMEVEGIKYHRAMPPNPNLQDLDIAELVTFLESTWGDNKKVVEVKQVQQALAGCKQKSN